MAETGLYDSAAAYQCDDLNAVAVKQCAVFVLFARDQLPISFHGTVSIVDFQLPQKVRNRAPRRNFRLVSVDVNFDHEFANRKENNAKSWVRMRNSPA